MPARAPAPARLDLPALARLCHRQWRLIAAVAGLGLVLGGIVVVVSAPRYTASVLLLVDPRRNPIAARPDTGGERLLEPGLVDGQVEILRSEMVARAAARALGLAADADFLAPRGPRRWLASEPAGAEAERLAAERVAAGTRVLRLGATQVIQVDHADTDPARAARIADAVAEAYMTGEVEARTLAARRASAWLQERLAELRGQVSAADRAVQAFRARHGIVDTARGLMSAQQLGDVNAQLVAARAATAEAEARLDRVLAVSGGDLTGATVAEALRNEVITRLRAQYLDLATREAELAGRYGAGSGHAAVVAVRAQMDQIARSAREELRRLAEGARSDHAIALAREESLARSLDGLVSRSAEAGPVQVELRNLESAAGSLRALYDVALRRSEEAASEETFLAAGARVIAPASVPSQPSSPAAAAILAAAAALGMALGLAAAVLRELLSAALRDPEEVEAVTGLPCLGVLPDLTGPFPRRPSLRAGLLGDGDPVARRAVEAPASRFAETLRGVAAAVDAARAGGPAVIGIVSAVPGEGKSAIAANLALLLAASGHRTLLIDADLRGPALTARLRPEAKAGLADLLDGQCSLGDVLCRDAATGLDFLPAVACEGGPRLACPAMAEFVAAARSHYTCVVIDLPPLIPVADVRAACDLFSHLLLVAAWGSTSRETLREALAVEPLRRKMLGVLLNRAEPRALALRESHRGAACGRYYREPAPAW